MLPNNTSDTTIKWDQIEMFSIFINCYDNIDFNIFFKIKAGK